jgi:hypothetical protein
MIVSKQSGTRIDEIASGVFRISTPVPPEAIPGGFTFNQYLIVDDHPLLYHTGPRKMFPLVSQAIAAVIPVQSLRYIGMSHFEADECGALNEFLEAAPAAEALCSGIAKDASSNGEPFRVTSGEGHAHSPVLARSGKGWVLAWLEEDPQKPTEAPKLHIASLHESGHALLSHHEFGTPDGSLPRQVDLDCSDTLCRVVLTTTDEFGRHSLYAGRISDEGQLAFVRLSAAGAGDAAFGLALLPSGVAFAESRGERPAWLRWGQILWAE